MSEFSILIGGKAGYGIESASSILGSLCNALGFHVFISRDYPSLIRGGHTFSIIRASTEPIFAQRKQVDFLLALNQETLTLHQDKLKESSLVIYDSTEEKFPKSTGLPIGKILQEEGANEFFRNVCFLGAFCKIAAIDFELLKQLLTNQFPKEIEKNIKVSLRGYQEAQKIANIETLSPNKKSIISGNIAISLGLLQGGLDAYISYPMTPTSSILHFMAKISEEFGLKVIHPESEIGVILMALGFSSAGSKVAVGTSGGGFCLMTEGLSFSGMAELPIIIILGQRPGPATGLPTYSGQSELQFALHAGHGEFVRFLVAPGDALEAFHWSAIALELAWKYQCPAIILSDKELSESFFSFDCPKLPDLQKETILLWDQKNTYQRYQNTDTGVSPLAFPPQKDAVIKINSYEHDEAGFTTENPKMTSLMQEKRLRKEQDLLQELEKHSLVNVLGNKEAKTAILCFGSNKGVCVEVANNLNLKVIQPLVLAPFPKNQFKEALQGIKFLLCIEHNATGQLAQLIRSHGFQENASIHRYDGRAFSVEELTEEIKKVLT